MMPPFLPASANDTSTMVKPSRSRSKRTPKRRRPADAPSALGNRSKASLSDYRKLGQPAERAKEDPREAAAWFEQLKRSGLS